MADKNNAKKTASIDAVYQKYARGVIRTLASSDFYEFFMDMIQKAENEFQFSNRRCEKVIDPKWVDAIDEALTGFQNIISNPRNVIKEEELVVNVAYAKKGGSDVVRHLAQHGNLVSSYDYDTHEVKPNKLMQKLRDDSADLYENRFVYTVLESAHHFVRIRYEALFDAMGDEFGAKLKMQSDLDCASETIHFDMFMHIKEKESVLEIDEKSGDMLASVARLYRVLTMFMATPFAQQMARLPRVKGTIVKTNVLKKNTDYKAINKLWEFLKQYDDVGYAVKVTEQNPAISEQFQQDLFHNIMYHYIVLKGYLEAEEDRRIPAPLKQRKRTLKPKFIREIVEELTEDYDLPDIEVRKVLIEELTKEQLMREEAEERRRLVEEQQRKKKEEEERLRLEKEQEKERIRQEREAEKERIRREKEAEEERLRVQQLEQENEDRRHAARYRKELEKFLRALPDQLAARAQAAKKEKTADRSDFTNAVEELEAAEQRRLERAERERRRLQLEQERLELARKEEERLRLEQKQKQQQAQRKEDEEVLAPIIVVINGFAAELAAQRQERKAYLDQLKAEREQFEEQRRLRRQKRDAR
ncbi:MAG: DUF2357 domain-containing protein [Clostridia bacterium]|nr:DUF2357 domain-containing protein [Clostridia bacterium]